MQLCLAFCDDQFASALGRRGTEVHLQEDDGRSGPQVVIDTREANLISLTDLWSTNWRALSPHHFAAGHSQHM